MRAGRSERREQGEVRGGENNGVKVRVMRLMMPDQTHDDMAAGAGSGAGGRCRGPPWFNCLVKLKNLSVPW